MTADRSGLRPSTIIAACLVLGALAVLIALGNWQVRRLAWKEDLIARVNGRITAQPIDLTGQRFGDIAPGEFLAANEYRPVRVDGAFLDEATVKVFTALSDARGPLEGPGYWVFTPLRTPSGRVVFVNRGFVPFDRVAEIPAAPEGPVTVSGPLRSPERGNFMTPDPDVPERIWHIRDPRAIAAALGVGGEVMPFFIGAGAASTPPGGIPQAGETRTRFANNHLQYAITWYGLAAALAGVVAVYVVRRQRGAVS